MNFGFGRQVWRAATGLTPAIALTASASCAIYFGMAADDDDAIFAAHNSLLVIIPTQGRNENQCFAVRIYVAPQ